MITTFSQNIGIIKRLKVRIMMKSLWEVRDIYVGFFTWFCTNAALISVVSSGSIRVAAVAWGTSLYPVGFPRRVVTVGLTMWNSEGLALLKLKRPSDSFFTTFLWI